MNTAHWTRNEKQIKKMKNKVDRGDEWIECRKMHEMVPIILQSLETNTTITHLDLAKCGLDNEKIKKLANLLQNNTTIKTLILSENPFGCEGAEHVSFIIEKNKTITSLCMSNHYNVGTRGLSAIMNALAKNTTLQKCNLKRKRYPYDFDDSRNYHEWNQAFFAMIEINTTLRWINLKGFLFESDPIKKSKNTTLLSLILSKHHNKNVKRFHIRNRFMNKEIQNTRKQLQSFWWGCIQQTNEMTMVPSCSCTLCHVHQDILNKRVLRTITSKRNLRIIGIVLEPLTQKSFLLEPGPTILSLTDEYSKIVNQVVTRKGKLMQGILMEKKGTELYDSQNPYREDTRSDLYSSNSLSGSKEPDRNLYRETRSVQSVSTLTNRYDLYRENQTALTI